MNNPLYDPMVLQQFQELLEVHSGAQHHEARTQ
jgi:hypothetical protein